jgi:hypothetical protein
VRRCGEDTTDFGLVCLALFSGILSIAHFINDQRNFLSQNDPESSFLKN